MKLTTAVIAATALFATPALVSAEGVSDKSPGHEMQTKGSVSGSPGASGSAPGQKMQDKESVPGTTGASGYAPSHQTTGAGVNGNVDSKAGGATIKGNASGRVK